MTLTLVLKPSLLNAMGMPMMGKNQRAKYRTAKARVFL
jgi:hypothetical protein